MKNILLNNLGIKIISILLAVLVWIIIANVDDYTTTKQITGIEIDFVNGAAITKQGKVYEVPEGTTIDIVVKGRRKIVENLLNTQFKAEADLSKLSLTNAVEVSVKPLNPTLARDISISYVNNSINVNVEDKVEQQLQIKVNTQGTPAEGYAVKEKSARPNLITIAGAASAIKKIAEAIVEVDVTSLRDDREMTAGIKFYNNDGDLVDVSLLEVDVTEVEVSIDIESIKEIPVSIEPEGQVVQGFGISDIQYQPTSIRVVGDEMALQQLKNIMIDVDVTGKSTSFETSVDVTRYLPEGVILVDENVQIEVNIKIERMTEQPLTVLTTDIDFRNENEEYIYIFAEPNKSYNVRVKGLSDIVSAITIADVKPFIDVKDIGEGEHILKVAFRDIDGIEIMDTIEVKIVVEKRN